MVTEKEVVPTLEARKLTLISLSRTRGTPYDAADVTHGQPDP